MVALVGFVVLIVTHSAAFAFQSSLTANPANLPLLVESGVIAPTSVVATGSAATSTATVVSGATGMGSLGTGLGAGVGLLGAGVLGTDFLLDRDAEGLPGGEPGGENWEVLQPGAWRVVDHSPDGSWVDVQFAGGVKNSTYLYAYAWCVSPPTVVTMSTSPPGLLHGFGPYYVNSDGASTRLMLSKPAYGATGADGSVQRLTGAAVCPQGATVGGILTWGQSSSDGCGSSACAGSHNGYYLRRSVGSAEPARWVETTITCKNPDGSSVEIVGNGAQDAGELLKTAGLMCPDGSRMTDAVHVLKTVGGTDVELARHKQAQELEKVPVGCWSSSAGCFLRFQREVRNGEWVDVEADSMAEVNAEPWRWRCTMRGSGVPMEIVPLAWCASTIPTTEGGLTPVEIPSIAPGSEPSSDFCNFGIADLLNPGSVFKAAGCAIRWAFVPEGDVLGSALSTMSAGFWQSGPGEWLGGMRDALMRFPDGLGSAAGGCEGPAWDLRWGERSGDVTHLAPLSACAEPFSTVAGWVKPIAGAFLALGGVLACVRLISGSFGAPAPSEGD